MYFLGYIFRDFCATSARISARHSANDAPCPGGFEYVRYAGNGCVFAKLSGQNQKFLHFLRKSTITSWCRMISRYAMALQYTASQGLSLSVNRSTIAFLQVTFFSENVVQSALSHSWWNMTRNMEMVMAPYVCIRTATGVLSCSHQVPYWSWAKNR